MAKPGLELGGLTVLAWKGTLDPAAYGKELAQPGEFRRATTSSGGGTTRNSGGFRIYIFINECFRKCTVPNSLP